MKYNKIWEIWYMIIWYEMGCDEEWCDDFFIRSEMIWCGMILQVIWHEIIEYDVTEREDKT